MFPASEKHQLGRRIFCRFAVFPVIDLHLSELTVSDTEQSYLAVRWQDIPYPPEVDAGG